MAEVDDLSRSLIAFEQNSTLVAVLEMSQQTWLAAGVVPGIDRHPLKKLAPDPEALLQLLERWRALAVQAGRPVRRIVMAFEAGRDGFWLARWLLSRSRHRDLRYPFIECRGVARAPPCEDRSSRY